jgi:hypothetical protein
MGPDFVTIMEDLTVQDYGTLKPIDSCGQLDILWEGFLDLVERVLLPMAKLGIVHADIRAGYDITSNVLCKLHRNQKGEVEKATMKLIDFESFVAYRSWDAAGVDGRYIGNQRDWDATTYVWWQCMAIAYSWKEAQTADSLRTSGALARMMRVLSRDICGPVWLEKFRDVGNGKISSLAVKKTLMELAKEFDVNPRADLSHSLSATM